MQFSTCDISIICVILLNCILIYSEARQGAASRIAQSISSSNAAKACKHGLKKQFVERKRQEMIGMYNCIQQAYHGFSPPFWDLLSVRTVSRTLPFDFVNVNYTKYSDLYHQSFGQNPLEFVCITGENEQTAAYGYYCKNGSAMECFPSTIRCNGIKDCSDGIDESPLECTIKQRYCNFEYWECLFKLQEQAFWCTADATCLNRSVACNGVNDCIDGEDELAKQCEWKKLLNNPEYTLCLYAGNFWCKNDEVCLDLEKKCDGHEDCADGEDESILECNPECFYPFVYEYFAELAKV